MSCWCGHGPWHHYGYGYPPQYPPPEYPPPAYYPPEEFYDRPRRRSRRRARDTEELEDYLQGLQDEIDRVRHELAAMRQAGDGEA
jgi:hypothetical protein